MSEDVDRNRVFQTTRVRTTLKNDVSWIHSSKQDKKEEAQAKTDQAVESRPAPVRQNSYILSTAKKFESVDYPLSSPLQETQFVPSEGIPANLANGEIIPPQKDAQPAGSTVETTDDTKPQAPTEELVQNGEVQPGKSVANTTAEDREEHTDSAVYQTNLKQNEGGAEVPDEVHVEEQIQNDEAQPASSTKENPETASPVEPSEQPAADTTAGKNEESADTTADVSNAEHSEAEVSADDHMETSAMVDTEKTKDSTAEAPDAPAVEPKSQEEPSNETEPANATHLEDAGVESEEIVQAATEVVVESSPNKSDVINATPGEEAAVQDSVEPVPQSLAESVSELPTQPAAETAAEESCEKGPSEEVAEVVSAPETPAVTPAAEEEAALQDSVDLVPDSVPVADTVSKSPTQPAAETAVECAECEVKSVASAEPVLKIRAGDVIECEVQPVDNTVVEQSIEPTPESAAHVVELSIKDAVEPVTDVEAGQDTYSYRVIELTDALDVELPKAEADPEPNPNQSQTHTEETKVNQQSDGTHTSEMFQSALGKLQSTHTLNETRYTKPVCAFCNKTTDGNVKLTLSEPPVSSHPECLKCVGCAKALGDLLTPMFLHNQVILCDGCFAKALKT